ncbi:hypothetical protein B0H17DRAFT_1330604 [Mycena rosella]|uniref:Uncharacterized protein n=1 Tax=Mycena rosella TaxID=1033263 RepID=A0AAD7DJA3_MYCRO|nr:hypothetical protein B0H17DRAFT_1330604 [Mycena rosella]
MIGLLAVNTLLVFLLTMTNWDRVFGLLRWLYSAASRWVTTSTVLGIYGLVLLYLLVVVHVPATTEHSSRKRRKKNLVPYYNRDGQLKGWVREEQEGAVRTESRTNSRRRTTVPPPLSPELRRGHTTSPPVTATGALPSRSDEPLAGFSLSTWNGFPDGDFRCHFTRQQVEDTSRLAFYWISDKLPGKRGSLDAVTPEKGKLACFKCAGIIDCGASVCTAQIAPGPNVARQIEALCSCGSPLRHRSCTAEWSVAFYRDGAVFENSGTHNHSKYTHLLYTAKNRKTLQLQEFISRQPVVLRSETNPDPASGEDDNTQVSMENVNAGHPQSDDGREDGDADESLDEMNTEDERALDPDAEVDEES